MGKTYITAVKYLIKGKIDIDGIVEKPDVVGAIFGQTEGLLGDEMDLRELQKSGRIGRIEVNIKTKSGKSSGDIELASSLDKFQTATLAAALETVDRVGPCEAKVEIKKIEDTRADKREFVVDRAKQLLKDLSGGEIPESKEISSKVRSALRTSKVRFFGPEKLTCGPDIEKSKEIIVVEGRADVLNLLSYGINNVVSLQGSTIPKSVAELTKKKETTIFVDGDRGGDIIVKQLAQAGKVDYVAKAPDGKEVEELTQKEILKQLKNKVTLNDFQKGSSRFSGSSRATKSTWKSREKHPRRRDKNHPKRSPKSSPKSESKPSIDPSLKKIYDGLKGSMKAALVKGSKTNKVGVAEMFNEIKKRDKLDAVVFDGIITQRLVELADSKGIRTLIGLKKAKLEKTGKVNVVAME